MHELSDMEVNQESSPWTLYYSNDGYPYWFNSETGESVWAQSQNVSKTKQEQNPKTSISEAELYELYKANNLSAVDTMISIDSRLNNVTEDDDEMFDYDTEFAYEEFLDSAEGQHTLQVIIDV